jgi:hypothetical protein
MSWFDDPNWRQFYYEASQQTLIDPAVVTAIARSETGDSLVKQGLYTLGIDTRGSGGSGGSPATVSNATHTFYAYRSGLEAARGLAEFLQQNPRYGSDVVNLFRQPAGLLARLVQAGYSGCPGPECNPHWDADVLAIMRSIGGNVPTPTPTPTPVQTPAPIPLSQIAPVPTAMVTPVEAAPELSVGGNPLSAIANAIAQLPRAITIPYADSINRVLTYLDFLGQTNLYKRLGLAVTGLVLLMLGIVFFGVSFLVDFGDVKKVARYAVSAA